MSSSEAEGTHTAPEFVRLGWCLVAPWTSPTGRLVWSVSHHLNGVEPGPAEWASWYVDLEVARGACRNSAVPGTSVVEVAVLEDDAARLLAREPQADWWDLRLLREGSPGSAGSRVLGHEPVGGQDCLLEHSWYCFDRPAHLVVPPHHVEVNEAGLVDDWAMAERVVDHCQQDRSLHGEIWVGLRLSLA